MKYEKNFQNNQEIDFIFDSDRLEYLSKNKYSNLSISNFWLYVCTFCFFVDQFFYYNVNFNRIEKTFRLTVDREEDDLVTLDDKLFSSKTKNFLALEYFQLAIDELFGLHHNIKTKSLFHNLNIYYNNEKNASKYSYIPGYVKMIDDLNYAIGSYESKIYENHILVRTLKEIYGMCLSC